MNTLYILITIKEVTLSKRIHINKKLRYDIDQKENFKIRNEKISFIK